MSISSYFNDGTVFVTGFPGFLGKLAVCKIVSCCPEVKTIYVLMRRKNHPDVQDRLTHTLECKIFDKLRDENANFGEKIVPLLGNVESPNLGLSEEMVSQLAGEVNVVLHLAQISRCDSHLREAVLTNVNGTRNVLELCKLMKNLSSVVCLSSVYANCNHATISEAIYQPAVHHHKLLNASGWLGDDVFNDIEAFLTKGYANSFTYTKALMEFMIQEQYSELPVSIVRPTIIGATWREPFPGWIDSNTGIIPLIHSTGKGLLRVLRGSPKSTAELIPADTVVNALLAAAWASSVTDPSSGSLPVKVYNLTNNAGRRLTWEYFERTVCSSFVKNPLDDVIRIPSATMTKLKILANIQGMFRHTMYAYVMDLLCLLMGRSPSYVAQTNKFLKALNAAQFFTIRDWKIENGNVKSLMSKLSSQDKRAFGIDTSCVHWATYIEAMCMGIKQHVAGESLANLNQARKSIYRIRWVNRFWRVVQLLILIRLASTKLEWAQKVWTKILGASLFVYSHMPMFAKNPSA